MLRVLDSGLISLGRRLVLQWILYFPKETMIRLSFKFLVTCFFLIFSIQLWSADQPNIIFFLADDLGYGDLGCYSSESKIPTPNLDKLAQEGMRFTDAHTPSGVCSPTRYAVLTGRYCWRTELKKGVLNESSPPLIEQ